MATASGSMDRLRAERPPGRGGAVALLAALLLALCAAAPALPAAEPPTLEALHPTALPVPPPGQAAPGGPAYAVRVRALWPDGTPAAGQAVRFSVLSAPAGSPPLRLAPARAVTDADGIAATRVTLAARPGPYVIGAAPANAPAGTAPVSVALRVRSLGWWIALSLGLAGGLAIFLYGMRLMSEGMKNVLGDRMRALVGSLTHNRIVAVLVGTAVTMVIQSSSATTVMLVGFVEAQLMTFAQTVGVILGARIGTTITAQIIAFRLSDWALAFVALGFGLVFFARQERWRSVGEALLGFGLLFFGMLVMAEAIRPLSSHERFVAWILRPEMPLLGVLAGALLTALIQSSSAFTGILIVLASQGLLTLEGAIPLVLGANIGTSITAALASIGTRREAKRVALAHTLIHVSGVAIFVWFVAPFAELVRWVSPAAAAAPGALDELARAAVVPRQIANAHTLFNASVTLLFLPFTTQVARLVSWMLPERPGEAQAPFRARYLDETVLATPAVALSLARAELVRTGELVRSMVVRCVEPFIEHRRDTLADLERMEAEVNFLQERVDEYLTRVSQRKVTEHQIDEAFQMMYAMTELEQIADIVSKSIRPRGREWLALWRRFSPQGEAEMRDMHLRTVKQVARAINLLRERSAARAARMREKYQKYRAMEIAFMRSHFERLRRAVPESVATNEFHQELMEQFVRITSHATNIARIVLEANAVEPPEAPLAEPSAAGASDSGQS